MQISGLIWLYCADNRSLDTDKSSRKNISFYFIWET